MDGPDPWPEDRVRNPVGRHRFSLVLLFDLDPPTPASRSSTGARP